MPDKIIPRGIKSLAANGVVIDRDWWLKVRGGSTTQPLPCMCACVYACGSACWPPCLPACPRDAGVPPLPTFTIGLAGPACLPRRARRGQGREKQRIFVW